MKRIVSVMVFALISGSASAQVAVDWSSTAFFVLSGGNAANYPADYLPVDALHLLIWSPVAPPIAAVAQPTTGIGAGEHVLWSSNEPNRGQDVREDSGRFNYTEPALIFNDGNVGGDSINSGYIYSRIFESSTPMAGEWYFQSPVFLGPNITVYDLQSPATIQEHITADVMDVAIPEMGVGSNMYQVIPEPSVFALLGLGGLFVIIRRRFVKS